MTAGYDHAQGHTYHTQNDNRNANGHNHSTWTTYVHKQQYHS